MDACFAGAVEAVVQRENKRSYEYLAACAAEKVTASPGGKSFTTALIQSLEQLLEHSPGQSFTTTDLHRTIKGKRFMNVSEPCLLSRSAYDDRRIRLAPLKKTERYFDATGIAKYLDLRIELKQENLTSEEVEDLAKTRRVDFVLLESPKRKIRSVVRAFQAVRRMTLPKADKPRLDSKAEVTPRSPHPLSKPSFFATLRFMSPNMRTHWTTFTFQRPWTWLSGIAIFITAVAFLSR